MTNLRHIFLYAVAATAAAGLWGCSNATCYDGRSCVPLAGLYSAEGQKILVDSLEVYAVVPAESDSVLAAVPGARISMLYLPLNPDQSVTRWVIAYRYSELDDPKLNDTITMRYVSRPYFVSDECGVILRHTITSATSTSHLVDAVELTDSVVTNIESERMRIYFRTSINDQEP